MTRVYFWNAEHLSTRADVIADERWADVERAEEAEMAQLVAAARRGRAGTPAVTRSMVRGGSGGPIRSSYIFGAKALAASHPYARPDDRDIERQLDREIQHRRRANRLEYRAEVGRRKCETQDWLETRSEKVFYCEVQQAFAGSTSSLRDASVAGAETLCYWTNIVGGLDEPAGFPAAGPGVPGPPGGPHLVRGGERIPRRADGGGGVNLFFWHAPSGNSGEVVAAVWNFIKATYAGQNILFGDLNCDPGQLAGVGVPQDEMATPAGATRISGRTLDYALADFAGVSVSRAFDYAAPHASIKSRFGSDHAAMQLNW